MCYVVAKLKGRLNLKLMHSNIKDFAVGEKFSCYTGSSKKTDGIWNRYNLKSTGRIYTFGVLKYSEKFKVLDLP